MKENIQKQMEEKLYQRNYTKHGFDLNPVVSITTGCIVILLSIYAFISQQGLFNLRPAKEVFEEAKKFIITWGDWLFILSSNFFIILCIYLATSRLGKVRLGGVRAKPEFTNFSWYSMLISAGMGIGLMFWAVGEPLYHSQIIPPIYQHDNGDFTAMATTFFHWGLHPWAIYAVIALALAFFAYNKKLPLSLRSVFYPFLKEKVFGITGDIIDILAVLSCLFGLATSLGLGVQQINSGLSYLTPLPYNTYVQVLLIVIITAVATLSVVSGIDKGVKFLSKLNIKIAFIFMTAIFLLGPSFYIIRLFINSLGIYFNDFITSSFFLEESNVWQGGWTIFYLAWWISWSPFVGMFIARISKGRTIREFVFAVLLIPSILSFVWLTIFGGTAIKVNEWSNGSLYGVVNDHLPIALFEMINLLNIPIISSIIKTALFITGTVLVISFFVTSSDSGSLVVDNITSGGKLNSPVTQRVFWACMEGFIAAMLLLIGGKAALSALQAAVISTGLPFAIILTIMSILLLESLQHTYRKQKKFYDIQTVKNIIKNDIEEKE